MTVGNTIRNALDIKEMTVRELADKTQITEVTLHRYLRDESDPKVDARIRIAEALEMNPILLFPELGK